MEEILIYPTKETTIDQPFGLDNTKHPIRKDFYTIFDNKHSQELIFLLQLAQKYIVVTQE